jgi:hypothetical protein
MMVSSHEFFKGRKTYPEIGGCYFASKLAVNELLTKEKRQAGIVVFREAHAGYIMPVGVWLTREGVRETLKNKPMKFNTLEESLKYITSRLDIPLSKWIEHSAILKEVKFQKRISDF